MSPYAHKLTKIQQKLNRLHDQRAKLLQNPSRVHRTRTLIQLGGLLLKSGWLETFQITPGDDLQNIHHRSKAEALLGALLHIAPDLDIQNHTFFRALGSQALNTSQE